MVITVVLFVAAIFEKGFTHDLLLEAGVFLVSAKLMVMSYKNGIVSKHISAQLNDIQDGIKRIEQRRDS